jgi:hypothetical protein
MKKKIAVPICVLIVALGFTNVGFAQRGSTNTKKLFNTLPPSYEDGAARLATSATTVPNFTHFYTFPSVVAGTTNFKFTMVGTDPAKGSATTTVPTSIIPVKLVFSGGIVRDPHQTIPNSSPAQTSLGDTPKSPIFSTSVTWKAGNGTSVGTTQYTDALQRASFWNLVSPTGVAPNYHLLLGTPTVLPTLVITVPAADGSGSVNINESSGATTNIVNVGLVDQGFIDTQFKNYIAAHSQIAANTLPIFMTYQTYLTANHGTVCCIGGYHTATGSSTAPQTYLHFSWVTGVPLLTFSETVASLSHEVAEWAADPFVDNLTPCFIIDSIGILEVGDVLAGFDFSVISGGITYQLQFMNLVSYFTGDLPSKGVNKQFTFPQRILNFPCSLM